jgi:hypothetical protein
MSRFVFEPANAEDDAELRKRMSEDWMPGNVSVSFRREPNYFMGSQVQAKEMRVFKCVDKKEGIIVGIGCRGVSDVYINGALKKTGYLSDLRCHPNYRGGTLLSRAYHYLHTMHKLEPVDLYYSMILEGNDAALKVLSSARQGLPCYREIGRFLTPAIYLDFKKPAIKMPGIEIVRATLEDMPELFQFINHCHSKKQFSPYYDEDDLGTLRLNGLKAEDFYMIMCGNKILGCAAAWDQTAIRQTHVEKYGTQMSAIKPLYNFFANFTSLKKLPNIGEKIPYFYLAFIAIENDDIDIFRMLIRHIYRDRRTGPWSYFIAGLHERDPLSKVLSEYRKIEAAGKLFVVHYPDDEKKFNALDDRVPYIEIASI